MSRIEHGRPAASDPPASGSVFEIRLQGRLDRTWADWFDGLDLAPQRDGTTILTADVPDQAALQGLLRRVGDLGATLISVHAVG